MNPENFCVIRIRLPAVDLLWAVIFIENKSPLTSSVIAISVKNVLIEKVIKQIASQAILKQNTV